MCVCWRLTGFKKKRADPQSRSIDECRISFYIRSPPSLDMELTPLSTSALASLIASPALRKGNPNDNLRTVFGDDITLEVEGVVGNSEAGDVADIVGNDKSSGVLEEVTEFDFASTSLLLSDDGTVSELTDMVENVIAKEGILRSLFDIPDASPDFCEISFESISSSE